MVLACVYEENVRTVVLGSVVMESGWEEDIAGLRADWHSSVLTVKGSTVMSIDEVCGLSVGLAS